MLEVKLISVATAGMALSVSTKGLRNRLEQNQCESVFPFSLDPVIPSTGREAD